MAYDNALAALADPTRRTVLERLRAAPSSVGARADTLPVTRPAVSQHLKVLKGARLVTERREGTRRIYSVNPEGIVELRRYLDALWDDVLAAFEAEARRTGARRKPQPPKTRRPAGKRTTKR